MPFSELDPNGNAVDPPLPAWMGNSTLTIGEMRFIYDNWMMYYSPDVGHDTGKRIAWLDKAVAYRAGNEIPASGSGIHVIPRDGYESTRWLIFPWNTRFPYHDGYDQAEFNLWLTIQFLFHRKRHDRIGDIADMTQSDRPNLTNWDEDTAIPRVEDVYMPRLDDLWKALLAPARPLSGREALEIIATRFMPHMIHADWRRYWWRLLRSAIEHGFTRERSADARLDDVQFPIAIRSIGRHIRYWIETAKGSLTTTAGVFDDPTSPWSGGQAPGVDDNAKNTYYPHMHQGQGTIPTDMFLYTEDAMAMSFVGACVFAYARAAMAGIIAPHALFAGDVRGTTKGMGAPNLAQFRRPTVDDYMYEEALLGRAAALRIIRARRGGLVVDRNDVKAVNATKQRLATMLPRSDQALQNKIHYLRWFSAVLRSNDKLEVNGPTTYPEAVREEPLLYEQPEGRQLFDVSQEIVEDRDKQRRRWLGAGMRERNRTNLDLLASYSGAPPNDPMLYDHYDDLPLTERQSEAIANAMKQLTLG